VLGAKAIFGHRGLSTLLGTPHLKIPTLKGEPGLTLLHSCHGFRHKIQIDIVSFIVASFMLIIKSCFSDNTYKSAHGIVPDAYDGYSTSHPWTLNEGDSIQGACSGLSPHAARNKKRIPH